MLHHRVVQQYWQTWDKQPLRIERSVIVIAVFSFFEFVSHSLNVFGYSTRLSVLRCFSKLYVTRTLEIKSSFPQKPHAGLAYQDLGKSND